MTHTVEEQKQNRKSYFRLAKVKQAQIKFVIIGQDPYPNDANGIPFCKTDVTELKKGSGDRILCKLNLKLDESKNGIENFHEFIERNGVLFLNLSYELLTEKTNKKRVWKNTFDTDTENAFSENVEILEELKGDFIVIKLGLDRKIRTRFKRLYFKHLIGHNVYELTHPSSNARRGNNIRNWDATWKSKECLTTIVKKTKPIN